MRKAMAEYRAWQTMKQRCNNDRVKKYADYGARGIRVCKRWQDSFDAFLEDMGPRPGPKYSIDRIDVNGHYEPANCRWATSTQQQRNKRNNTLLTHRGQTLCIEAWAERIGIPGKVIHHRLSRGWSVAATLDTPRRTGSHKEWHARHKRGWGKSRDQSPQRFREKGVLRQSRKVHPCSICGAPIPADEAYYDIYGVLRAHRCCVAEAG